MTKVMTKQEEMRARLVELLCNVNCKGDDRREGGCGFRQNDRCNRIEKLDMCMVECIAEHLLAEGVMAPPVKRGQTVYAVLFEGDDAEIYPWQVQGVAFMSDKWYAVEKDGSEWEVGAACCHLTQEAAEQYKNKRMEEIKHAKDADKIG